MYTYLYRLGDRWVQKYDGIAQPRSAPAPAVRVPAGT
eukprot:SAG22_NODE_237_length_14221_cov_37.207832_17_plen_37_part_00